jgi:lipoprotein-releasing system permease protein
LNFSLYIAKRYLLAKSSNNAINIIAWIAISGVIIGTMALCVVLAGFSGLKTFSLSYINASDPDLRISASSGKTFTYSSTVEVALQTDSRIKSFNKALEERAFFSYRNKQIVAYLKGVDQNFVNTSDISDNLIVGNWINPEISNQVVLGNSLSGKLSIGILNYGDPLSILVPKTGSGYISNIQKAFTKINVQAIGVFNSNEKLNDQYVFTSLETIQGLLGYQSQTISQIDLRIEDSSDIESVKETLSENLGSAFKIETREELNAVYYRMLNTENLVSYLIFTFIVVIALFNVVGAIIMMILDKKQNLKTLFALGAEIKEIKRIFIKQGFLLSQVGLYIGIALSLILILLQQNFELLMITRTLAYPVELKWTNFLLVILTISILGYVAAKISASRINKSLIEQI